MAPVKRLLAQSGCLLDVGDIAVCIYATTLWQSAKLTKSDGIGQIYEGELVLLLSHLGPHPSSYVHVLTKLGVGYIMQDFLSHV